MRKLLLTALALSIAGCQPTSRIVAPTKPADTQPTAKGTADPSKLSDMPAEGDYLVLLDIYQLIVPMGGISQNEEFWRRVDEDHVDLANHDMMSRNGIRYGLAPTSEWPYFTKLIDKYCPKSKKGSTALTQSGFVQLTMRQSVELENIIYISNEEPGGKIFHNCENLLNVSYETIPHRPGETRIKMAAVVRDLQQQWEVTVLNQAREVNVVHPYQLYDLKLEVDVPNNQFLIVAPSEMAKNNLTLGNAFFVEPDKSEQSEIALVIVPRPFRTGKAMSLTETPQGIQRTQTPQAAH